MKQKPFKTCSQEKHIVYRRDRMSLIDISNFNILSSFWRGKMQNALESKFQKELKNDIHKLLPNCVIKKNEGTQGFPDLLILYENKWAALEVKRNEKASHQPNQDNYISKLSKMSYASFIFPENKEEVLNEVFEALQS